MRMSSSVDTDFLFASALAVWNRALDAHRGTWRYSQILAECQELFCHPSIRVEVYDEEAGRTIAQYDVRFRNGVIETTTVETGAGRSCRRVSPRYLEQIVEHAERFIRDPEKLNREWLEGRVGVGG
jgi:hypothetical protein